MNRYRSKEEIERQFFLFKLTPSEWNFSFFFFVALLLSLPSAQKKRNISLDRANEFTRQDVTENSLDLGRLEPLFDYEMSVRVTVSHMRDATSPSTPTGWTCRANHSANLHFKKMRKTVRGKTHDQISRTDRLYSVFSFF